MENKINIAELLKDCPQGMKLDCSIWDNVVFDHIDMTRDCPIYIRIKGDGYEQLTKYGQWNHSNNAKCVIFPKDKTTWEGFQRPFKDGDIIVGKNHACSYITIFKEFRDSITFNHYVCLTSFGKFKINDFSDNANLRLATEEEKAKLFKAIKAHGYKWNAETKTLKKLVEPKFKVGNVIQDIDTYKVKITEVNIEDECYEYESMITKGIGSIGFSKQDEWELVPNKFDITTLKPFDKVLVRDSDKCIWCASFFSHIWKDKYFCVGAWYNQCIPYGNNGHLLGTTDDCDEFYQNW